MDFICIDLIGEFHPPTSRGHRYALTAVCMLTGFTWCVPLKTKTAEEVTKAYMDHFYCSFGGSIKILMDNGTEFKNKLFKEVISKLGTEFSIHSPPYRPQSNGKIEGFHRFLKTCIGKHINYGLEWDELTPMATACYNFFPNCNARESAFFIMFGRDPINKLNMLLHAARRYFHHENGFPNLEALKNIYQVVAQQLLNSRERYVKKHHNQQRSESPVQAGDLILIKDKNAKSFEPLYKGNYRVVKVHGNNVEIRDYRGNISMVHVTDVKKITLMEQVADEYENLGKEGRFSKKCIPRGYIPDFDWTTIHPSQDQPIKPIQQEDPTEDTTTPAAPTEVEGPPSSHLRSKTKQQHTSPMQEQPECNPTPMDPPEHNPAEIELTMEEEHAKAPSHNNPEGAAEYVRSVTSLTDSFDTSIRGLDRYLRLDAWQTFIHSLSQLLLKLDSAYFTKLDPDVILDTIPDKACDVFLARPEEAATRIQQRVSSDKIPEGHEIMSKMRLQNLPCFDKRGQQAVTRLFNCLQEAHSYLAEVANQVVLVSEVSSPEQFTFVLQHAV